jgi:hypothetical protein
MQEHVKTYARNWATFLALCCTLSGGLAWAANAKEKRTALDLKEFFRPELYISSSNASLDDALSQLANRGQWEAFLAQRGEDKVRVFIDPRSGAVTNLVEAVPLIPGRGEGNRIKSAKRVDAAMVEAALKTHLQARREVLGIDLSQLGKARVTQVTDHLWQVSIPQTYRGVVVRDARLAATINQGNLVLLGAETWGDVRGLDAKPRVSASQALDAGFAFADGRFPEDIIVRSPRLEIVPFAPQEFQGGAGFEGAVGQGYGHRLVWSFVFQRAPEDARWEVLVDAHNGEVIAFQDKNQYVRKKFTGGVYPLTDTGVCPNADQCGVMQLDWPMPFADTSFPAPKNFTNSHGVYNYTSGTATTTLTGRYVNIADTCGNISNSSPTGDINLGGANNQHDCTSGGGSAGNTPATRSAFYEVNKLAELARGWLPGNAWLNAQLTANVNLNNTCNAFWNGATINFYKSGGGCRNTGEIAAVFDHEWGHGMDDNDANGVLSNSSEGYADIAANYRLEASCVGHGFFQTINQGCGMTADGTGFNADEAQVGPLHCDLDCSGVRDSDWAKHNPNTPDTPQNFICPSCGGGSGPCGKQVHCAAATQRQAAWDLVTRDLTAGPFNMSSETAFITGNRLFYLGSGNIGQWYACSCPNTSDGCAAQSGYMQWLAADDDNGNVNTGTPHMTAIHAAFNRHNIACANPAPQNSGCAGGPTAAPTVTLQVAAGKVRVKWTSVPGATGYWVYRSEGHAGCNFGKTKIADLAVLSFDDKNLLAGRTYYYNVVAHGGSTACFGPASNCANGTPTLDAADEVAEP